MSQRMDLLKKEDPILEYDLIDCFRGAMDQLKRNFGWATVEPLAEFLNSSQCNPMSQASSTDLEQDTILKNQFKLLLTGQCTKQSQV